VEEPAQARQHGGAGAGPRDRSGAGGGGLSGSDFIAGWKRRDEPVDVGLVDEASMLDDRMLEDLQEIFGMLALFGDPAQLPPVSQGGGMAFDSLPEGGASRSRAFTARPATTRSSISPMRCRTTI
jgi:exodeoxyribonuclease-5